MADESKTFFSYAREDSDFVLRVVRDVRAAGAAVWLDQLDIGPGLHWDTEVEKALRECSRFVTVLSLASVNSANVMDEVSFALEQHKQVIPLFRGECEIPFRLRRLQYIDFRGEYAAGLQALLHALGVSAQAAAASAPEPFANISTRTSAIPDVLSSTAPGGEREPEPQRPVLAASVGTASRQKKPPSRGVDPDKARKRWLLAAVSAIVVCGIIVVWRVVANHGGNLPFQSPIVVNNGNGAGDAQSFHARGEDYYGKKQYDQAIEAFTQEIHIDPNRADAYKRRGNAYDSKRDYDRAIQDFSQALELKPDYAEAYSGRCYAYYEKRDYDRAIQDCDQAVKLKPDYETPYCNRGLAHIHKGDYDSAIQDFGQALKLKPSYVEAYLSRCDAYDEKRDYDRAIQDCSQALKLKPDYAEAYNNRGIAYEGKGKYTLAMEDYDRALSADPSYAKAQQNRDRLAAKVKR